MLNVCFWCILTFADKETAALLVMTHAYILLYLVWKNNLEISIHLLPSHAKKFEKFMFSAQSRQLKLWNEVTKTKKWPSITYSITVSLVCVKSWNFTGRWVHYWQMSICYPFNYEFQHRIGIISAIWWCNLVFPNCHDINPLHKKWNKRISFAFVYFSWKMIFLIRYSFCVFTWVLVRSCLQLKTYLLLSCTACCSSSWFPLSNEIIFLSSPLLISLSYIQTN